ncbi:hypothetical protein Y032_0191g1286 [Ancylostoma ceylanicum]|uniref:Uncharacterized protein n=1 Tax=Ancylostoma ceylanicum TaxID=53326 RepID=A0A016SPN0_9BILA|nr:hypothetical protein Y032_0191g1286 [Ancylostoma ceylanicum]
MRKDELAARGSWFFGSFRFAIVALIQSRPCTLSMVCRVGHGRSLKHAFVLIRLSTRTHTSHHACQPVEHIVTNVLNQFRCASAVELWVFSIWFSNFHSFIQGKLEFSGMLKQIWRSVLENFAVFFWLSGS